jgi:hypothetical protein
MRPGTELSPTTRAISSGDIGGVEAATSPDAAAVPAGAMFGDAGSAGGVNFADETEEVVAVGALSRGRRPRHTRKVASRRNAVMRKSFRRMGGVYP